MVDPVLAVVRTVALDGDPQRVVQPDPAP